MKKAQSLHQSRAVIITGASSGLGEALANRLFFNGWNVLGISNQPGEAERHSPGGNVWINAVVDLAEHAMLQPHVTAFIEYTGRLDAVVNNAALQLLGTLEETEVSAWSETLAVNLTAPFVLAKLCIPALRSTGGGTILNVSSIHGTLTGPRRTAYAAAKGGLAALTRAIAMDYGAEGIRALTLSPGPVATQKLIEGLENLYPGDDLATAQQKFSQRLPIRRIATPGEFARFAECLLDAPPYVTGTEVFFDGGLSASLAVGD